MRLASLNARISRWAVTGFASTVLAITALAAGPSAPAALADVEPASAVSQEETEFTDAQTDVTSPTDQNGGVAANDGLSSSGDDLLMTTDADGLVGTDYYFDGLDDGSLSQGPTSSAATPDSATAATRRSLATSSGTAGSTSSP